MLKPSITAPNQKRSKSNKQQTYSERLKALANPAIELMGHLFYTLLGGKSSYRWALPSSVQSQPVVIEIHDDVDNGQVTPLYTLRNKKKFTHKQFKQIAQDKYQVLSNFAFSRQFPNLKSLSNKFVELNPFTLTDEDDYKAYTKEKANDLLKDGWISDGVINLYMRHLCKENNDVAAIDAECFRYKDPDFATRLRTRDKFHAQLKSDVLTAKTILWPICENSHWYLVILKKNASGKYDIYCLDGFNSPERKGYIEAAQKTLAALLPKRNPKTLVGKKVLIDIPVQSDIKANGQFQTNYVDCGSVVGFWAKVFTNKIDVITIPQGACDYSSFRLDIASSIIEMNNKAKPRSVITID